MLLWWARAPLRVTNRGSLQLLCFGVRLNIHSTFVWVSWFRRCWKSWLWPAFLVQERLLMRQCLSLIWYRIPSAKIGGEARLHNGLWYLHRYLHEIRFFYLWRRAYQLLVLLVESIPLLFSYSCYDSLLRRLWVVIPLSSLPLAFVFFSIPEPELL